ncbi:hypothetical protein [Nocardiopsis lambiniae]|uniref:Uncharacterized protein n=1 Tax=Nocardiopsis lambiniae TaxID=3075539 RepID=A0ABU2M2F4_9ACTN|nr:hypothetical protein [Nocardiopsis sp. DSM 44743]MDT0326824.1 hypothetical protein [Nocardiopsis sp. DSM 44743]
MMNGIHLDDPPTTAADALDRGGARTDPGAEEERCARAVREALRRARHTDDAHAAVRILDRRLRDGKEPAP